MIAREDQALPADQSQRPPLRLPDQPEGKEKQDKQPELPPLHFPQRPDGQGLAPAPGGSPPPPPPRWQGQAPPPGTAPKPPPGAIPRWQNGRQPSGPGPGRPPGPVRPLRPPEQPVRHRAIAALVLGVLSLLSLLGVIGSSYYQRSVYLLVFGIVVGLIAGWFGITAMRTAARSGTMRPRGAIAGTVVGGLSALLGAVVLIYVVTFWSQLQSFSQCVNTANTQSAQQACLNHLPGLKIGNLGTGR